MTNKEDICVSAYALKGFMKAGSVHEAVNKAISEIKELRQTKEDLEVRLIHIIMELESIKNNT